MIIELLRHGEPIGGRLYRGHLVDDALSEKGWMQMQQSTENKNWDLIATSPMLRCLAFAQYLSNKQSTKLEVLDNLKEIGFGVWQGKSANEIGLDLVKQFKLDPVRNIPKDAEKLNDFKRRVLSELDSIRQKNNNDSKVLIVAHAGVIRVIKSHILNLPIEKMFTIEVVAGSCERFEI